MIRHVVLVTRKPETAPESIDAMVEAGRKLPTEIPSLRGIEVGAGANVILFTTGLGTPTGNPIAPVLKISTNSSLAQRMPDIIDIDAGGIISGVINIEDMGETILERVIQVASGEARTKAEMLSQDDFIPWKRGVSL